MKCVIPSQNVKILSRALHSLARIGDELFVEPNPDELIFRTVNMAQSAYGAVTFQKRFFSCYIYGDASSDDSKCKISMKSCLMVFRTPHCMDRDVESCQIKLQPGCDKLIFQIKRNHGITKTNFLPIIDNDTLQANYSVSECVNKMCAEPKFLSSVVKNFRANEGEVTLLVSRQSTVFKNHIENHTDVKNSVRTELNLNAGEFEGYSVGTPTAVTFCLKELRAVLLLAEPIRMPVNIYFDTAGKPIVFSCGDKPLYEAVYVLSTLNADAMSQTGPPKVGTVSASVPSVAPNVCDRHVPKTSRKRPLESDNMEESVRSKIAPNNISIHNDNTNNSKNNNSNNNKNSNNNNSNNNKTINNSCLINNNNNEVNSEYGQRDYLMDVGEDNNGANQFNFPSTSKILSGIRPLSQQNSENTDQSFATQNTELAHIIFARCFNQTFHKKDLPGYNKVLVYDSDGMEDSD